MAAPVLTCVQFDTDGVTCTQTAWVQQQQPVFPPLSAADGQTLGAAIFAGCVALAAINIIRRA